MRKDGRTDRHDEANSRIRSFANAPNNCYLNVYRIHVSRSSNPHFRELSCLSYPHCQSCNFYEHHLDSSRINITSISWHTDWFILAKSSDSWLRILLKHIDVQIRWISENNWREKFLKQCKTTSKAKLQIFWDVMLCHCVCVCVCVFIDVSRNCNACIFREKQFKINYIPEYANLQQRPCVGISSRITAKVSLEAQTSPEPSTCYFRLPNHLSTLHVTSRWCKSVTSEITQIFKSCCCRTRWPRGLKCGSAAAG